MAYAITQTCCADASCVSACPVNCIHPTPDEAAFATTDMLYIDPRACIDCGACADACPVNAIVPVDQLAAAEAPYTEINRQYFDTAPTAPAWAPPRFPRSLPPSLAAPRVAVVGTGPAAGYTVQTLLRCTDAEITVLDRSTTPGGLIRYGVAPDHPATKRIQDSFATALRHPRVRMHLGVEVGRDLSHEELAAHHHAVVYAVGAGGHRALDIPGEGLPGTVPATTFVAWCNGSPEARLDGVDLTAERAVIIGNGNVALDVARLLLTDSDRLAGTPIAEHALAALRTSRVREVVLLARRGPEHAAYTAPEFLALRQRLDAEIVVDHHGDPGAALATAYPGSPTALLADLPVEPIDWGQPVPDGKRLVLRFSSPPRRFLGDQRVTGVRVGDGDGDRDIPAGLVVSSIGARGVPLPGLPIDPDTGAAVNTAGRVRAGTYVVGWAKRGASGGIGANRVCAEETVDSILDDILAGRLTPPERGAKEFARLVRKRTRRARAMLPLPAR